MWGYWNKAMNVDLVKVLAAFAKQAKDYRASHPGHQKAADHKTKAKALKEKRFLCATCCWVARTKASLTKHLNRPKHAAKLNFAPTGDHNCFVCRFEFRAPCELAAHLVSARHATRAAFA